MSPAEMPGSGWCKALQQVQGQILTRRTTPCPGLPTPSSSCSMPPPIAMTVACCRCPTPSERKAPHSSEASMPCSKPTSISEVAASKGQAAWKTADDLRPITLVLTDAGRAALETGTSEAPQAKPAERQTRTRSKSSSQGSSTRSATLLRLLSGKVWRLPRGTAGRHRLAGPQRARLPVRHRAQEDGAGADQRAGPLRHAALPAGFNTEEGRPVMRSRQE